jgi:hypothetical protein
MQFLISTDTSVIKCPLETDIIGRFKIVFYKLGQNMENTDVKTTVSPLEMKHIPLYTPVWNSVNDKAHTNKGCDDVFNLFQLKTESKFNELVNRIKENVGQLTTETSPKCSHSFFLKNYHQDLHKINKKTNKTTKFYISQGGTHHPVNIQFTKKDAKVTQEGSVFNEEKNIRSLMDKRFYLEHTMKKKTEQVSPACEAVLNPTEAELFQSKVINDFISLQRESMKPDTLEFEAKISRWVKGKTNKPKVTLKHQQCFQKKQQYERFKFMFWSDTLAEKPKVINMKQMLPEKVVENFPIPDEFGLSGTCVKACPSYFKKQYCFYGQKCTYAHNTTDIKWIQANHTLEDCHDVACTRVHPDDNIIDFLKRYDLTGLNEYKFCFELPETFKIINNKMKICKNAYKKNGCVNVKCKFSHYKYKASNHEITKCSSRDTCKFVHPGETVFLHEERIK